jgi:hypothetical protein
MQYTAIKTLPASINYYSKSEKFSKKAIFEQYVLLFIYIVFSVSIIELFLSKLVLFIITFLLGLVVLFRYKRFDKIVYQIMLYMFFVQFLSMWHFETLTLNRLVSFGLAITRFLLGFFIIKLGGKDFLTKFEKFSFTLIIIGLPLFFLDQYFPQVSQLLSSIDFNSTEIQREYDGWNIFVYVHNGWAGFRFSGYSWEPGGMAMMITLSWVIYILNHGTSLNLKVLIYFLAMVFTFSTTGYFVLGVITIFYIVNSKAFSLFVLGVPVFFLMVLIFPYVWKQDFMQKKITGYIAKDQEVRATPGGYSKFETSGNIGRYGAVFSGIENIFKWPLGHGTVTTGRTKSEDGEVVSGANGLAEFLILWGFAGLGFLLFSLYRFIYYKLNNIRIKHKYFLLICVLLVFLSNPVSSNPVLYSLMLFPHLFKEDKFFRKNEQRLRKHAKIENNSLLIKSM